MSQPPNHSSRVNAGDHRQFNQGHSNFYTGQEGQFIFISCNFVRDNGVGKLSV